MNMNERCNMIGLNIRESTILKGNFKYAEKVYFLKRNCYECKLRIIFIGKFYKCKESNKVFNALPYNTTSMCHVCRLHVIKC